MKIEPIAIMKNPGPLGPGKPLTSLFSTTTLIKPIDISSLSWFCGANDVSRNTLWIAPNPPEMATPRNVFGGDSFLFPSHSRSKPVPSYTQIAPDGTRTVVKYRMCDSKVIAHIREQQLSQRLARLQEQGVISPKRRHYLLREQQRALAKKFAPAFNAGSSGLPRQGNAAASRTA